MSLRANRLLLGLTVLALLSACDGGGNGGDSVTGPENVNVAGDWAGDASDESGPGTLELSLTQSGTTVSGTLQVVDDATGLVGTGTVTGTVSGSSFDGRLRGTFAALGCSFDLGFDAQVQGNSMQGTYSGQGCLTPINDGEFSLTRQ